MRGEDTCLLLILRKYVDICVNWPWSTRQYLLNASCVDVSSANLQLLVNTGLHTDIGYDMCDYMFRKFRDFSKHICAAHVQFLNIEVIKCNTHCMRFI